MKTRIITLITCLAVLVLFAGGCVGKNENGQNGQGGELSGNVEGSDENKDGDGVSDGESGQDGEQKISDPYENDREWNLK